MRIVLVSGYEPERSALQLLLADDGHEVFAVPSRDACLELAENIAPDAVVADAQVLGIDGLALVRALSERNLRPRVILFCPRVCRSFEKEGVICLTKPIKQAELRRYLVGSPTLEERVA